MSAWRQGSGQSVMLALAAFLLAPAVAAAPQGDTTTLATWLQAPSATEAEAALQSVLERLQPEQIRPYLVEVGQAQATMPPALRGAARRRLLTAHLPLLSRDVADSALVDWFAMEGAEFLAADGELEGALALLADTAPLLPQPPPCWGRRWRLEIDCLIELQQLVAADRRCSVIEARVDEPLERAQLLARRATLDVMLGRLDQASRRIAAAAKHLDELASVDAGELRKQRFTLLQRQLDLLAANEQCAAVHSTIARFVAEREQAGKPLSADDRLSLDVYAVAADYRETQHEPERAAAVRTSLEALRHRVDPRRGVRLTLWLADLELRANHTVRAAELLAATATATNRSNRGLAAVIAAELARHTDAGRDELLGHEATLRTILQGMIAEWREIASEGESTGFLRLGMRLRVLGELIALTSALHGPERALEHVLAVQCCTRLSRARGAEPVPLADIRAQLLGAGGVLVYAPAWNASHLFACDRDEVLHELLPRASELRLQAAALRQELLALAREPVPAATLTAVRERSVKLAQSLLPPRVRERMERWNHLVVTGANLLGSPPLPCLPWDGDTLLGERFALATTASLPLLFRLHAEAGAPVPAAALPVRVFATLTPAAAFASRNELGPPDELAGPRWDRLLGLLPSAAVTIGAGATVSAYEAGASCAPRLTFLLAHGEAPSTESPAALGLSPDKAHEDGLLTPAVVRSVRQHGVHVVSSCHGARGRVRMGDDDGAESLADALLFAGATAVVASPAQLRASLHLDADAEFATALLGGVTPAEALRRARLAAAGGDPVQRYRAAQLELIGLGTVPLVSAPARSWAWPWLVAALVAAAIVITSRRRWAGPAGSGAGRPSA